VPMPRLSPMPNSQTVGDRSDGSGNKRHGCEESNSGTDRRLVVVVLEAACVPDAHPCKAPSQGMPGATIVITLTARRSSTPR
jgi:hypothetical protein